MHIQLKATDLLLDTVRTGAQSECWIACQCLAENNHYDDCIISEMLKMIQNGVDPVKRRRIEHFFKELSKLTVLLILMLTFKQTNIRIRRQFTIEQWTQKIHLSPILFNPVKFDALWELTLLSHQVNQVWSEPANSLLPGSLLYHLIRICSFSIDTIMHVMKPIYSICFIVQESIQYMLSEKLNSTSLNDRTIACQLFPILSGPLKKVHHFLLRIHRLF